MKTIKQKLMGIALSVFSIASFAQCPTITDLAVTYGANGTATISPVMSGPQSPTMTIYYWNTTPNSIQTGGGADREFQFPTNGRYTVCVSYHDSLGCSAYFCDSIIITNMASTSCQASFTTYRDSNCVTHFVNSSSGSNLTYQWNINGTIYTSANPDVSLPNGNYNINLRTYSGGFFCDSTYQMVSVNCGGGPATCNAAFAFYTDSNCVTHLINQSTGSNLTYVWTTMASHFSTQQNPSIVLGTGAHYIGLMVYSSGQLCDSVAIPVTVNCGTVNPNPCQADASFSVYQDSVNAGNYFAYNASTGTGNVTYLWNFGDGTSSTQQYPFHQYAVPGHYILCLTVSATSGTNTCSDTYCDSSSVHRMSAGFLMSQIQVIPQSVTGIKDQETVTGLKAFPNPMADELTVELEMSTNSHKISYQLIDALGKVISKNPINDSKTIIHTGSLDKGFYFLQITDESGKTIKTTKLVK